jgi:hypothetical protein
LPTDDDFTALATWLTANSKWNEWNTGFALAGFGISGSYSRSESLVGFWWSSSSYRQWHVVTRATSGDFGTDGSEDSNSVRCVKKP